MAGAGAGDLLAMVEAFLYREADLLDERRYDEWLATLADDVRYFMPVIRNVKAGTHATAETTRQGLDAAWFDEGKETLTNRVRQIQTGVHWAEEPLSRTVHIVTNVRIAGDAPDVPDGEVEVSSKFVLYRNRADGETDTFVGSRRDTLRRGPDGLLLAARTIHLAQNVLLAKNMTVIF